MSSPFQVTNEEHHNRMITLFNIAKQSNLLIFSRETSKNKLDFGKKIRPFFKNIFFSSEQVDCQKLLNRYNNSSVNEDLSIDLVSFVSIQSFVFFFIYLIIIIIGFG